jgi:hypothetical protein
MPLFELQIQESHSENQGAKEKRKEKEKMRKKAGRIYIFICVWNNPTSNSFLLYIHHPLEPQNNLIQKCMKGICCLQCMDHDFSTPADDSSKKDFFKARTIVLLPYIGTDTLVCFLHDSSGVCAKTQFIIITSFVLLYTMPILQKGNETTTSYLKIVNMHHHCHG